MFTLLVVIRRRHSTMFLINGLSRMEAGKRLGLHIPLIPGPGEGQTATPTHLPANLIWTLLRKQPERIRWHFG